MHTGNQNNDVTLTREFQHYLTKEHRKNGVIDQVKYNKQFMEIKWTDRQYHVQGNVDFPARSSACGRAPLVWSLVYTGP